MIKVLLVGVGGFLGSVARYWMSGYVQARSGSAFPAGTLAVNVLGCFLIGVVVELAESKGLLSAEARAFAAIGVLGGFTTFSAFGSETLSLMRERGWMLAAANVAAQLAFGLLAVWAGRQAAGLLWK